MGKKHTHHSTEFRAEAVRLAETSGESIRQVAMDLGISNESFRRWIALARERPAGTPLEAEERAELTELRRRVKVLETEREIPCMPRYHIEQTVTLLAEAGTAEGRVTTNKVRDYRALYASSSPPRSASASCAVATASAPTHSWWSRPSRGSGPRSARPTAPASPRASSPSMPTAWLHARPRSASMPSTPSTRPSPSSDRTSRGPRSSSSAGSGSRCPSCCSRPRTWPCSSTASRCCSPGRHRSARDAASTSPPRRCRSRLSSDHRGDPWAGRAGPAVLTDTAIIPPPGRLTGGTSKSSDEVSGWLVRHDELFMSNSLNNVHKSCT